MIPIFKQWSMHVAKGHRLTRIVFVAWAAALLVPTPALAQFSDGYEFLKAVKEKDGDTVTNAVSEPGSTLINTRDISSGETALHIVTARRDVTWIKFLTLKGANPNIRDNRGVTPLVLAARLGFVDGVEALIKAGARVEESNSTGETPLIFAVHNRNAELVRVLLDAGANPDRADNSGRSARDYAKLDGARSQVLTEIERADAKRKGGEDGGSYGPDF